MTLERQVHRRRVHSSTEQLIIGVAVVLLALVGFSWAMGRSSYDSFGAVVVLPVLVGLTFPLAIRSARRDGDPALVRIAMLGLAAKVVGSLVRYYIVYDTYGGTADAATYHLLGTQLAHSIRSGHFAVPHAQVGTQFIVVLTGLVYAVVGSTKLGGFFLFAWLGFLGQYLFYRAFRLGFPDGDTRRYAVLVFFLPSEVFWPSSLGKEAWMTLMLGMFAYGAAKLLTHRRGAFFWMVLGLWGAGAVRPHVALIAIAALAVVYPFRRARKDRPPSPVRKAVGLTVMVILAVIALQKASSFFGVQSLDPQSVTKVLKTTATQTGQGGSQFTPSIATNPVHFPGAFVTVLFRPFPFEGHNSQARLAGAEGIFLILVFATSWRRLKQLPKYALRNSYMLFCIVYVLAFVFAFSSIANFGILVRERVQELPFLLAVACLPPVATDRTRPRRPALRQAD